MLTSVVLARTGDSTAVRLLTGWPLLLPLPPAAFAAGLIGALSFGQEFRYPALAPDVGSVPRRLGLLGAKLVVSAAAALLLAVASVCLNGTVLHLLFGESVLLFPAGWPGTLAGWAGLTLGCAWAGLLAAGLFRSTALGLVAVMVVPTVVVPLLGSALSQLDRPVADRSAPAAAFRRAGAVALGPGPRCLGRPAADVAAGRLGAGPVACGAPRGVRPDRLPWPTTVRAVLLRHGGRASTQSDNHSGRSGEVDPP
ncbi:hypothetical protein GCM10020000_20590 [Streptomyces olivoverticillatus]